MELCNKIEFDEVHLWTFKGLDAAQKLYKRNEFQLTLAELGKSHCLEVLESKFIRKRIFVKVCDNYGKN